MEGGNTSQLTCIVIVLRLLLVTETSGGKLATLTAPTDVFCVTRHPYEYARELSLNQTEMASWKSAPKIIMSMNVMTTVAFPFEKFVVQYRLGSTDIPLGSHTFAYNHVVNSSDQHGLEVTVDGKAMSPHSEPKEARAASSDFKDVAVNGKGPLTVEWGVPCPVETAPEQETEAEEHDELADLTEAGVTEGEDSSGIKFDTVGKENREEASENTDSSTDTSKANSPPLWLIIMLSLIGVGMIITIGVLVYVFKVVKPHNKRLARCAAAEKEKQRSIKDAKRLSHQEQLRWAESARPFVPAGKPSTFGVVQE